ncbi:MAG: tetratricopeptide repeat protein, partial [Patescibacteria group bacterium]
MEEKHTTQNVSKLIENVALWVLVVYAFTVPVLFLPFVAANVFDFPKWLLTAVTAVLLLILTGVYMVTEKKVILPAKQYLVPICLFIVAVLASVFFSSSNKIALLYGKAGLLLSFAVILFSALVIVRKKINRVFYSLLLSSFILSWIQVFTFLEILPNILRGPIFAQKTFTPIGSQLALASFLSIILPMSVMYALKTKDAAKKIFYFVVVGLQTVALVFAIAQLLPGQPANPKFLPFSSGWSIAMDQLKTGRTALFGVGPDKFAIAFSKFRPAILNQSEDWVVRFGSSSNEWLTVFTTMGVLGLAAFVILSLTFAKKAFEVKTKSPVHSALTLGFTVSLVLLMLIPGNIGVYIPFFMLGLLLVTSSRQGEVVYNNDKLSLVAALPLIALPLFLAFFVVKAAMAEVAFGQSLVYASENKGGETYRSQIRAITLNPYIANYRLAYSNTNLALANSLASKEELTDEDRQNITQLVSQSIREAKAAVALDPQNVSSWANLAQIYRQLINFAEGADQWAVSSYVQAIRLDNTNPQLRLDLGGLLYSLNSYEEAVDQFKQAIALKPDFANAY